MAFSRLVYEAEGGGTEKVNRGDKLPFNSTLRARDIRVGEDGEWVVITYENTEKSSEGSLMIPKERVVRLGGPDRLS